MRQLSWGLDRDGLWLQTFEDEGTGFGLISTDLGRSISVRFLGRGLLVGWMYRRKIGFFVTYEDEE